MISTYCGSFGQRAFRKHIAECGVCWDDAQTRGDLDFNPESVPNPTQTDKHAELISRDGWESDSEMERRTR